MTHIATPPLTATDTMSPEQLQAIVEHAHRQLNPPKRFHVAKQVVYSMFVTFTALAAGALVVIPRLLGAVPLTVLSQSMEPNIMPGDVIVSKQLTPAEGCDLRPGDVVTYLPHPGEATTVSHRVTNIVGGRFDDGSVCQLTVKGDANVGPGEVISPMQVRGRMLYVVPKIGLVQPLATEAMGRIGLTRQTALYAAGGGLLAYSAWAMLSGRRSKPKAFTITMPDDGGLGVQSSPSCYASADGGPVVELAVDSRRVETTGNSWTPPRGRHAARQTASPSLVTQPLAESEVTNNV